MFISLYTVLFFNRRHELQQPVNNVVGDDLKNTFDTYVIYSEFTEILLLVFSSRSSTNESSYKLMNIKIMIPMTKKAKMNCLYEIDWIDIYSSTLEA
jgi:hypothetical protein